MNTLHNMKATLLLAILVLGTLSACKKDKDEPTSNEPAKQECQLKNVSFTVQGNNFTNAFTYNDKNQLIESKTTTSWGDSRTVYTYNVDGTVSMKEEFEGNDQQPNSRVTYHYSNNALSESKYYVMMDVALELVEVKRYEFATGRLRKVNIFEVSDGSETLSGYLTYLYNGSENVQNIVGFETDGTHAPLEVYRRALSYDTKTTLKSIITMMTDDPHFPANNNITSDKEEMFDSDTQTWEVTDENSYTYTYGSNNLPATVNAGAMGSGTLTYNCN